MAIIKFALQNPEIFEIYASKFGPEAVANLAKVLSWGYEIQFGIDSNWFYGHHLSGNVLVIDSDDNFIPFYGTSFENDALELDRAIRLGLQPTPPSFPFAAQNPMFQPATDGQTRWAKKRGLRQAAWRRGMTT